MATSTLSSSVSGSRVASAGRPAHQSGPETPWFTAGISQVVLGFGQHRAQPLLDVVELGLADDQRRGKLDHRVTAVVGPAVQAGLEQRLGQEPAQQTLALVVVEGLAGGLVLDQLDPVEVALTADIADQWQVEQLVQGGPEPGRVVLDMLVETLPLEDVQVGHRDG